MTIGFLETPAIAEPLGAERLRALTDPATYLGAAQAMVDRVLAGRPLLDPPPPAGEGTGRAARNADDSALAGH